MKCTTDWEKMYKVCLKESERIEQELATLKASLPKIKADAVREAIEEATWYSNQTTALISDMEEYANKLEAGE